MILLRLQIDNLRIYAWSRAAHGLAADILQRTSFMSKYTRESFRADCRLVSLYSQQLGIVVQATRSQSSAIVTNKIHSQSSSEFVTDDTYCMAAAAKTTTRVAYTYASVVMTSSWLITVVLELANKRAGYTTLEVARGLLAVTLNDAFYILLTLMLNGSVHIPKRITATFVADSAANVIATETALLKADAEASDEEHYQPSMNRDA